MFNDRTNSIKSKTKQNTSAGDIQPPTEDWSSGFPRACLKLLSYAIQVSDFENGSSINRVTQVKVP